jgi:hypothetical protein
MWPWPSLYHEIRGELDGLDLSESGAAVAKLLSTLADDTQIAEA